MTPEHMTDVIRTAQRVIKDHYKNDADPGDTLTLLTQALGLGADVLRAQAASAAGQETLPTTIGDDIHMIEIGKKAKDGLTGFEGIVTGITTYQYGCVRVFLEPENLDKDGKPMEGVWFDEQRVSLLPTAKIGGPMDDPGPPIAPDRGVNT